MRLAVRTGALLLLGACAQEDSHQPRPSDPLQDGEEHESQEERQRWLEGMHLAAPGLDWREVEQANRDSERLRRNEIATGAALPPPGVGAWEEVGSSNQAGHTRATCYGPDRPGGRRLYVGSANGGLWQADMNGQGWTPLSDGVFGGVDEVVALEAITGGGPDVLIYRAGNTFYRSDDGGASWTTPSGLGALTETRNLSLMPGSPATVLVYGRTGSGSILLASTDKGATFTTRKTWPNAWSGDMWVPQVGSGAGSEIFVYQNESLRYSTDGGLNWTQSGSPGPATEGHLTGSEAGGKVLYLMARQSGNWVLYRTADWGASYQQRTAPPEYWGSTKSLCALSTNANQLVTGGVNAYRTSDGAQSWQQINSWGEYYGAPATKLHADIRGIDVHPDPTAPGLSDHVYFNTDGGTYRSIDGGQSVQNLCLSGLGVGQFYSTLTDASLSVRIHGGTQDQGYQIGNKIPSTGPGPSTPMTQIISGDYGHLTAHAGGSLDRVYAPYPGFTLVITGPNSSTQGVDFPPGSSHLWLPPTVADPTQYNSFFFCGRFLWRQYRLGGTWQSVQHSSRDFGAGAGDYLSALAFSKVDPSRAWAANNAGRLWRSTDGGVTWTESSTGIPGSHYFYGNCLAPHPTDPQRVVASGSGYSTAGVRISNDGGLTWTPLANGLPQTMVYDVEWAANGTDDLCAATDAGAWYYDSSAGIWINAMGLEAPATTYWSVERVPSANLMRFGTYGRGIWDLILESGDGLGTRLCTPAVSNSTGASGRLEAAGSLVPSNNDLTLTASDLPTGQFGYFLTSRTSAQIPFPGGSAGILCLGSPIGRYNAAVQNSGSTGTITMAVDLTAMPMQPSVAVQPGDTWVFQAWYRDFVAAPTSNFTDALSIQFQ